MNKKEYSSQFRIYYEDTDAGGIVYYANYLRFFERARTEVLRTENILQSELTAKENLIFVVINCNISYKKPALLDDLVEIKTSTSKVGGSSLIMHQEMFCKNELLSILDVTIVCIDATTKKPKKIPSEIKNKLIA